MVREVNRAFSAGGLSCFTIPGALPQVRHGESVSPADESVLCADLWRTGGDCPAPLALLNTQIALRCAAESGRYQAARPRYFANAFHLGSYRCGNWRIASPVPVYVPKSAIIYGRGGGVGRGRGVGVVRGGTVTEGVGDGGGVVVAVAVAVGVALAVTVAVGVAVGVGEGVTHWVKISIDAVGTPVLS